MSLEVTLLPRAPEYEHKQGVWKIWVRAAGRPTRILVDEAMIVLAARIPADAIGVPEVMAITREHEAAICDAVRDAMAAGLLSDDHIVLGPAAVDWSAPARGLGSMRDRYEATINGASIGRFDAPEPALRALCEALSGKDPSPVPSLADRYTGMTMDLASILQWCRDIAQPQRRSG